MGVGTEELLKQIETGNLRSVNFLPNFADKVREFVRESGQLEASLKTSQRAMGRFKNAFEKGILNSFEAGTEAGLSDMFKDLAVVIKQLGPFFRVAGKIIGGVLSALGQTVRALTQLVRPLGMLLEKIFGTEAADNVRTLNGELQETVSLMERILNSFRFSAGLAMLLPAIVENRLDALSTPSASNINQAASSGTVVKTDNRQFNPTIIVEGRDTKSITEELDNYMSNMNAMNFSEGV